MWFDVELRWAQVGRERVSAGCVSLSHFLHNVHVLQSYSHHQTSLLSRQDDTMRRGLLTLLRLIPPAVILLILALSSHR